MNKLFLGFDSPSTQSSQSRRIKRLPLWALAAISDRETGDFARKAGSSSGQIYNMNNQFSRYVKKPRVRKLGRTNTVPVRPWDGRFGRLYGFGGGGLPKGRHTQRVREQRGATARDAEARFLERYATAPFVVWMQVLIEGRCGRDIGYAVTRKRNLA